MFRPPKGTPDGWGFEESHGAATCISNPKHLLAHGYISDPGDLLRTAPARGSRYSEKAVKSRKLVASTGPYTGSALREPRGGKECLGWPMSLPEEDAE